MIFTSACPGLKPGWFLLGDVEMWYPRRHCVARQSLLRDLYVGVCADCSLAFNRRGFRVNYEDVDPDGEVIRDVVAWHVAALPVVAGLVYIIVFKVMSS